jgi:hypothetical protein
VEQTLATLLAALHSHLDWVVLFVILKGQTGGFLALVTGILHYHQPMKSFNLPRAIRINLANNLQPADPECD